MTRLLFTTDIHGSERCWSKLLNAGRVYQVDVIVLGGDITGNGLQPLVRSRAETWRSTYQGEEIVLETPSALHDFEAAVRAIGLYPFRTTPEELIAVEESSICRNELAQRLITASLERWIAQAESKLSAGRPRLYVIPGNDDPPYVDNPLRNSKVLTWAQRQVVHIDDRHEMASEGFTNITPWRTYREMEEDELHATLERQIELLSNEYDSIFNFHAPPYDSQLDDAPVLDKNLRPRRTGRRFAPVGSTAVRRVIEEHQPLLGLHGHIHESKGATYIGRTLCLNPGSRYEEGALAGYLITLEHGRVRSYQPVLG
jgi:uncharacterized protein